MPPAGFEPTILAKERPQTHALDRAATGIGKLSCWSYNRFTYFYMQLLALFPIKKTKRIIYNNNYTLHVKCLSLQSEQVLTELSCDFYLEGSAAAAAATATAAAGLARPVIGLIVSIATNV